MTPASTLSGAPPGAGDQAAHLRALVAQMAGAGSRAESAANRAPDAAPHAPPAPPRTAPVVAVASGKGGVGKSNFCVNVCIALAERGVRPLLLDADLGLANADVLCGVTPGAHLGHVLEGVRRIEEVVVRAPGGFSLVPGVAGALSASAGRPERRADLAARLARLDSMGDLVLIDCGAGIGSTVMTFISASDAVIIVTTPEPTAIADAYGLIKCLALTAGPHGPPAPRCALFVNQASGADEACRAHRRIAGVCERFLDLPLPLLGWAPADPHVPMAVRARTPLLLAYGRAPAAKALRRAASSLSTSLNLAHPESAGRRGLIQRLFGSPAP